MEPLMLMTLPVDGHPPTRSGGDIEQHNQGLPDGFTYLPNLPCPAHADDEVPERLLTAESYGWTVRPMTAEEMAATARKVWPTVADFWAEFSDGEKLAILGSDIGGIVLLREELRMWRGEVWSDDPRVQQGLGGLVAVGILTTERREEILEL
jgi:hypothetical protein